MLATHKLKLKNNKLYKYEVLNGREVRFSFDKTCIIKKISYDYKHIFSITVDNHFILNIGEIFFVNIAKKDIPYRIYSICKLSSNVYIIKTHPDTKSSHFLLPVLGKSRDFFDFDGLLINTYLYSNRFTYGDKLEADKFLYLLYRYVGNSTYCKIEERLLKHSNFKNFSDPDFYNVLYVFEVPKVHYNDILKFKEGKYSEFSEVLKHKILAFHSKKKSSKIGKILYKSKNLKGQMEMELQSTIASHIELYDKPNLSIETY